jgi:hypothetical protein
VPPRDHYCCHVGSKIAGCTGQIPNSVFHKMLGTALQLLESLYEDQRSLILKGHSWLVDIVVLDINVFQKLFNCPVYAGKDYN